MTQAALIPGYAALVAGALALYLASRRQKAVQGRLPRRLLAGTGLGLLAVALLLLLDVTRPASAIFMLVTGAILVWTAAPLAIAYWRHSRDHAR